MNATVKGTTQIFIEKMQGQSGYSHFGWTELGNPLSFAFYENWIDLGLHGEMRYLKEHLPIKRDPSLKWPHLRSAFSFAFPYFPVTDSDSPFIRAARISTYAFKSDYHFWLKEKLESIKEQLQRLHPTESFLCVTDSSPLLERDLARKAGLGWVGKNTCLIHPKKGSLFLLGEILTSLPTTVPTELLPDFCGTCRRCIEACPTEALTAPRVLDARKCISYLTIESREVPAEPLREKIGDWLFGCDICQTVCPWNQKIFKGQNNFLEESKPLRPLNFEGRQLLIEELRFFLKASGKQIQKKLKNTALLRAGPFGMRRNSMIVAANHQLTELTPEVSFYLVDSKLSELAAWTIEKLNQGPAS